MKVTKGKLDPSIKLFGGSGSGVLIPFGTSQTDSSTQPSGEMSKGKAALLAGKAEWDKQFAQEVREQFGAVPEDHGNDKEE